MSHLISLSIDATKATKSRMKHGKYINITVSINDETDRFGNNVSCWENQTKEERERGEQRNFLGNGIVLFTQGAVFKPAAKPSGAPTVPPPTIIDDGVPF